MRNPHEVDHHAEEKGRIVRALQSLRVGDDALFDPELRATLRRLLKLPEPAAVVDPKLPPIPSSPIRSADVIDAYLARGYDVQPMAARTSSPVGRPIRASEADGFSKSAHARANLPLNASVALEWPRSLALVFERAFDDEILERFERDVASLEGVPIIIGQHRYVALLVVPHGHYFSRGGPIGDSGAIHAENSSVFKVVAPPSFDPSGHLDLLTFRDATVTKPTTPSPELLKWLSSVMVVAPNTR